MALDKLNKETVKLIWTNNTKLLLKNTAFQNCDLDKVNCVQYMLKELHKTSFINTDDFEELVQLTHGDCKNPLFNQEWKFASILTSLWLIDLFDSHDNDEDSYDELCENIKEQLEEFYPEYKVDYENVPYSYNEVKNNKLTK